MSKASDMRWGRQGGRFLPDKPHDQAAIDRWREQRDAMARAADAAGEQLDLFASEDDPA